ncbi:unnamed protein product [Callosobruchus maculatus]|uniref:Anoctamin n=1 Tax=Callosobruchus maculatus TaxID=64391 RepID=A0A653BRL0_CALMS|nr:unnamed protein product [Callosobruchus maculatus]
MSSVEKSANNDQKSRLSDKLPLLRSNSSPVTKVQRDKVISDGTYSLQPGSSSNLPRNYKDHGNDKKNETFIYTNKMYCDKPESLQDISAMSILSLYQNETNLETEMDTCRDFKNLSESTRSINMLPNNLEPKGVSANNKSEPTCSRQCCSKHDASKCTGPKIFFSDGKRSVDYILVWDALNEDAIKPEAHAKRQIFETNLVREGLELEYEPQEPSGLNFIKIHAPKEVLRRYSEILKLRMPMKRIPALRQVSRSTNFIVEELHNQWDKLKFWIFVDKQTFPDKGQRFTAIYSRDREYLFDVDAPSFFTPAIHSRIVQFILDRKRFSNNPQNDFAFGIERLLNEKAYAAAYPLHDGDLKVPGTMRYLLYTEWAAIKKWYKYQPLDYIKEYFGVKIALYFAWLGFYTHMLTPAAIVGLACFIYSCATLYSNQPSEDICNQRLKEKMCPLCDVWCDYWDIKESCVHARITYLFDNPTTVFFAIFMSIWEILC